MISKRIIIAGILIILIIGIANAMLSGSHELFKTEPTPQEFCSKCHLASAANVSAGAHSPVNCLCHGYNPNSSSEYNVNMTHDLTKNIYCTNCHSKYNETSGDIVIYSGISGLKQSAHYIIDKTDDQLYNNSRGFFSDPE
ncbi:MAG: hypothetical protein HF976_09765 [ANME-2 cluster archaeon]|nr:hypothetical protein [ANME-2 cluster archaeon]MBC2701679.1 hypothetical protein [ANME-2 cluster archaeon]MBC2709196.1 hypothetical protein [ANME-2 cluster archaeon]MBC2746443.1 hypothetical protein [ANME-2 cluster archaeon]